MNPDELKKLKEDADNADWNHPGIVVKEGRYYDRTCLINLPRDLGLTHGGDLMGCIWRFDDKPDEWILTWRIRYNAGPNSSPWAEGGDRKSWHFAKARGGEVGRKNLVGFLESLPLMASAKFKTEPLDIDWLVIQGGPDKWIEVVKREKRPWMHIREEQISK